LNVILTSGSNRPAAAGWSTGGARRAWRLLGLTLLVAFATGCLADRLQFGNDHRLTFASPAKRERVQEPVVIAWTMKGFDAVGLDGSARPDRGAFVVFLDRAPMPIGKNLRWLGKDDPSCRLDARCPDASYLATRGVYVTSTTGLTVDVLPRVRNRPGDEQHFVNVVLVDGTGRRIRESAWYLPFQRARRPS
jgi:hypothetical protein